MVIMRPFKMINKIKAKTKAKKASSLILINNTLIPKLLAGKDKELRSKSLMMSIKFVNDRKQKWWRKLKLLTWKCIHLINRRTFSNFIKKLILIKN